MLVAVKAWVDGQIATGGALGTTYTTVWGSQDGPRPVYPYAVLRVLNPPHSVGGKPAYSLIPGETEEDPDITRAEFDSEFAIRLELLSRAPLDAASGVDETVRLIHAVEASLWSVPRLELLQNAGLALVSTGPPTSIPVVVGFGFERRSYLDVVFRARTRVDAETTVLDSDSFAVVGTIDDGVVTGTVGV